MDTDRDRIRHFIEKASELAGGRYAEQLRKPVGVSIRLEEGVAETGRTGPDEEAVRAAVLTVRFFCQNNEPISIRNMDKFVGTLPAPQKLKDEFSSIRNQINAYLDRVHSPPSFTIDGHTLTNREILDAFLYGKYAHLTKHKTVSDWERLVSGDGIRAGFDRIMREFIRGVVLLSDICRDIDTEISTKKAE